MSNKVISRAELEMKMPFMPTVTIVTALAYWDAPVFVTVIMIIVLVLWWIIYLRAWYYDEKVEVLEELEDLTNEVVDHTDRLHPVKGMVKVETGGGAEMW